MRPRGWERRGCALLSAFGFALILPASVDAQAWVSPQGEGSVSVLYQHIYDQDHLFSDGSRSDVGHIRAHNLIVDIDYGLTDRVSLSASLPFVASKYNGLRPHRLEDGPTVDDGTYQRGLQDVRFDVRYNAVELPVSITPFAALNVPSHDYEFFAHSAIGLNLKEVQLGLYAGTVRAPFYVQGRYSFGVFDRVIGRRRNRSNIDAEVGWLVSPRLRVFAFELGQISHGGIELVRDLFPRNLTAEEFHHHDQLARANILDVGGGAALALTPSMSVVGSVLRTVTGVNTHADTYGLSVAASWTFGGRGQRRHGSESARSSARAQQVLASRGR